MSTNGMPSGSDENVVAERNKSRGEHSLTQIIVRLDNVPATGENRRRLWGRVRELNRSLEESGTPFRVRLL